MSVPESWCSTSCGRSRNELGPFSLRHECLPTAWTPSFTSDIRDLATTPGVLTPGSVGPGLWDNRGMGLPSLLPCPGCARHIRRDEEACPFCGREVGSLFRHPQLQWFPAERLVPALLAFASVSVGVTACHGGERPTTRLVAAAPSPQMATFAPASAPAVPVASVAPSASVSALPSASAAQAQTSSDPNVLVAPGSRPMAVYGAPGGPFFLLDGWKGRGAPVPPSILLATASMRGR